ncbi:TPA: acyl-CoA dehydrogenase [Pseudomonas putida]|jgi:alkylation response protein AidB-like acyl-CoA dehydrogenase|uniref:Acyl-CoA dehydrogenase n=3 Tax=Pseudomonas TaxID=286 RepID=A0A1Y3LF89_PSEPU|nr:MULTISPECIES: acyl-CoA dehydrogenase [Pseudomonas]PNB62203.1 acyl-CoA dehydrogenase [Pseudomonas sp. FW305-130]WHL27484.1 acyl-CoA dehydrogenase [Pseudomonas juntendi]EKT4459877.1 acyl-CoA dehydrogenase [Pseudomonas putida]EKT4538916.1 acyl-CoA dehydrogenase [Pseudomonas putida]EKT4554830.1 acyl-CoA dehydrogenase [Pseudomonas putida]
MMELTHFDSLLHRFAHRSQAIERDASLIELMQALQGDRLDVLPLPGQGCTLERWRVLARVAGYDLSLAKLYEGHTDALAILAECGAAQHAFNGIWGVWAAEPPDARAYIVERDGERVRLQGRKAWCSGALQVDRALLTAWEDDQPQLVAIELPHPSQRILAEHWQAVGMAATRSVVIEFDDSPGLAIGSPGQYLSRPGFWQGGAGIAACWYGAAEALAGYLHEQCRKPRRDPHADAHLGAVDAALYGARAALRECATWIDLHPQDDASFEVRRTRAQVEQAVEQVIQHAGRALGATPFCCSSHFARLSADLPVYIRQSHAERDLAELGRQLTGLPAGAWQL